MIDNNEIFSSYSNQKVNTEIINYAPMANPAYYGSIGISAGGTYNTHSNLISYNSISTLGNSTTFGNLKYKRNGLASVSNGSIVAFAAGMDDYLAKPIEIDKLLRKIVKVLEKK